MKIKKRPDKKHQIALAIFISLLVIVACGVVYVRFLSPKGDPTTQNKPTQAQTEKQQDSSDKPQGTVEPIESSSTPETQKNIPPAYEGVDANQSSSLTGTITYSSVSGSSLVIRTAIDQTLSSGTCQLTLTNGNRVVTKTSSIAPNPSSSTCEGFDIAVSELSSGKWDISIEISSGDKTGTLAGSANV